MMVVITLLPGMIAGPVGVMMVSPVPILPLQNSVPSRLAATRFKGPPFAPESEFQMTRTVEIFTASCGFVIVIAIVLPAVIMDP